MSEEITVHVVKYKDRDNLVMRYRCPLQNRQVSRSTGTTKRKEAEKLAAKWEAELREGRYQRTGRMGWDEFVEHWADAVAPTIRPSTYAHYDTALRAFKEHARPERLCDLTTARVTSHAAALRDKGLSEASVKRHLSGLRAIARWAHRQEMLAKVPSFDMPKHGATAKMKGRPITGEEFDRMLDAVEGVVGSKPAESWKMLLRGLWWSGLRLGEAMDLRWDQQPGGVWVSLEGRKSVLMFDAGSQKSGRVEIVPLAPEAAEMLSAFHQAEGYVFAPMRLRGGVPMQRTPHKISQIISKIGKAAGVVVNRRIKDGEEVVKYASAHDLRRAFGFRWSRRIMPAELMHLMRHKDIKTTMTFYAGHDAGATAEACWDALGTNLGTTDDSEGARESENPLKTKCPRQDSNLRHTV